MNRGAITPYVYALKNQAPFLDQLALDHREHFLIVDSAPFDLGLMRLHELADLRVQPILNHQLIRDGMTQPINHRLPRARYVQVALLLQAGGQRFSQMSDPFLGQLHAASLTFLNSDGGRVDSLPQPRGIPENSPHDVDPVSRHRIRPCAHRCPSEKQRQDASGSPVGHISHFDLGRSGFPVVLHPGNREIKLFAPRMHRRLDRQGAVNRIRGLAAFELRLKVDASHRDCDPTRPVIVHDRPLPSISSHQAHRCPHDALQRNLTCLHAEIKVRIPPATAQIHEPVVESLMIQSTFVLLKGVGEYTERRLWEFGVEDWESFLNCHSIPGIAPARKTVYDSDIASAIHHLRTRQSRYFARCLKSRDHWRLFEAFKAQTVYLDIETTGLPPPGGDVTVVGLFGFGHMTTLLRGDSLTEDRLNQELSRYSLIVTFFGSVFDVPYLRAKFPGLVLDQPHFDLCFAAKRLGLLGGLKQIESQAGIERATDLQGLDGWDAVRLWQAWRRGQAGALDLLLRYNESDTRNLEPLAELIYGRLLARYRLAAPM